jgi:phage terminase large subunit GpA-like protein
MDTPSPALLVFRAHVQQARMRILAPPPSLTVSEWADRFRKVPSYSAEAGQWVTDRTPYLREIMDSMSEPGVNRVVFQKCARIGATEAGLNMVGYFIHQDPSAIMIVQPTVDDAKDFSKEQLAPTIEDTDVLRERVSSGVKDSKNTIVAKVFPGGSVVLGGANSPRFFRRRTVRFLVLEEVDGYGGSAAAKAEGDQMGIAEKRTETYGYRRKVYINSTPTLKGHSRIAREFKRSDQRYYHVPCPHCGHRQRLMWERLKYKDVEAPAYQCAGCEQLIDESDKDAMVAAGEWVVTNPLRETRGYHLNALYSPFVRWLRLVEEWEDAQGDPEKLQVFINTALGEEWEDREAEDLKATLVARSTRYDGSDGDGPRAFDVPKMGCVLVCGVDKQAAELHYVVRAYGPGEQSWLVDWGIFRGDTSRPEVWAELEQWRTTRRWVHEGGARLGIRAMCVDSGDDPDPVYAWTRPRLAQHVYAIKGSSDPTAPILPKKFTRTRQKSRLYVIGVQAIKKRIFRRMGMAAPDPCPLDVSPSFMHFNDRADATYWDEMFSQRSVWSNYRGKRLQRYELLSGKHDEKLDGEVYAYAALHLGPVRETELMAEWERVMAEGDATRATPAARPEPDPTPVRPAPRKAGFVTGWKKGFRR